MMGGVAGDRRSWSRLLQARRQLDVPEGWRAEVDEGRLALAPPPHRWHHGVVEVLHRALYRALPEDLGVYQNLGVHVGPLGALYVPGLVVAPREVVVDDVEPDSAEPLDAAEALLVVEIASRGDTGAGGDRGRRLRAYGQAPVPVYLLVDRYDAHGPTATVFREPQAGAYRHAERVAFGECFTLPEPLGATVDTEAFPPCGEGGAG
ncbi:Uma2 family endonuclease [Streptomyces sp. G45]|uniref:Uma2 family endonuclease n=1 Tax=Streptomyces sp. G45 TaxID=3406627 RepID=UPI003C1AE700